jgi:hypothetical protein
MRDGWLADILICPEATLGGSATGDYIRPAGIRDSDLRQQSAETFQRLDAWGHTRGGQALQFWHQITLVREFSIDQYADLVLAALSSDEPSEATTDGFTTTARTNRTTPEQPASFRIYCQTTDLRQYLAKGCALAKVEWFIQAGRGIIEETSFQVLRLEETDRIPYHLAAPPHRLATALHAEHAFAFGSGAWDPTAATVPAFSGQLIMSRSLAPRQYDETGQPTRYETRAAWELVGKTQVRNAPRIQDLRTGAAARLWWRIRNPSDPDEWLTITAPRAFAKAMAQPLKVKGTADDIFDFIATSNNGGAFATERRRKD